MICKVELSDRPLECVDEWVTDVPSSPHGIEGIRYSTSTICCLWHLRWDTGSLFVHWIELKQKQRILYISLYNVGPSRHSVLSPSWQRWISECKQHKQKPYLLLIIWTVSKSNAQTEFHPMIQIWLCSWTHGRFKLLPYFQNHLFNL